ncbi:hypothetical protein ACHAXT_002215 [Thalassiosira profunda]
MTTLAAAALLLAALAEVAEGRVWWSLEVRALDSIRDADPLFGPSGASLLLEDAGFLNAGALASVKAGPKVREDVMDAATTYSTPAPSDWPTTAPPTIAPTTSSSAGGSAASSVQKVGPFPTDTPTPTTLAPSFSPLFSPSLSPSEIFESANGGCLPNHSLHRLWLYDSADDGWGSTTLVVKEIGKGIEDAAFVGTLSAMGDVMRYEAGTNVMGVSHAKTFRMDTDGRKLDMTLGGSITGPAGTITWDANGEVEILGPDEIDSEAVNGEGAGTNPVNNSPEKGLVSGSSGTITWGNKFGEKQDDGGESGASDPDPSARGNAGKGPDIRSDVGPPTAKEWTYLCLRQDACYNAKISGGTFLHETRWEITRVELGTGDNVGLVAKGVGGGTGTCEFSLDGSCAAQTCDGSIQSLRPTDSPTEVPSQNPSRVPTAKPTNMPVLARKADTPAPTLILPQDKPFGFGIENFNNP